MELYQLQYFAATARTGSMLAAAAECSVTQPTLSVQIKALEDELGVRLFDRHARGVRLTRVGDRLLGSVDRVVAELRNLRSEIGRELTEQPPVLRIGIQPSLATEVLPRTLQQFMAERPDWRIVARESRNDQLLDLLLGEHVDICVMTQLPVWPPGVAARALFQVPFAAYCPEVHPLAVKRSLALRDLLPYPLVLFNHPMEVGNRVQELAKARKAEARVVFTCDLAATAFAMAAVGVGVAVLPAVFGGRCGPTGMRQIRLRDPGLTGFVSVVWRRKSGRPPALERFLALGRAAAPSVR